MKFLGCLLLVASLESRASVTSLYEGRERLFSRHDYERIVRILSALGLDHSISPTREILIPSDRKPQTQELVAQTLKRVRPNEESKP
jgi:DNA-binding transcriptional MerR regulator